ncbi:MAG: hypothetical protein RIT81_20965 [Deltaproteobacteria bacterium]
MTKTTAALLFGALFLTSANAAEAQDDGFNETVSKAMNAYRNKQYAEAIVEFERAYEIRQQPELVYNIARAHEKSLQSEEAIEAYERFLALPGTTADLRAKALQSLGALKREQAARRAAEAPPPPAGGSVVPPPSGATTAGPPVTVRTQKPQKSRALEYALIGTGAAAVLVGAAFGVVALQANGNFEDEKDKGDMANGDRLQSLKDDVDRNAAIADVAFIGGAVLGAVGVVLLITTGGDDEGDLALSGGVTPDGGMLTLGGRF